MKMDSYRRFVRSPLYQSCTLESVEGNPLPQPGHMATWDDVAARSQSLGSKKVERDRREYKKTGRVKEFNDHSENGNETIK